MAYFDAFAMSCDVLRTEIVFLAAKARPSPMDCVALAGVSELLQPDNPVARENACEHWLRMLR